MEQFIERDLNNCPTKVWLAIDRLLIIWKSNLSDKTDRDFFKFWQYYCMDTPCGLQKMFGEKARWELHKNATFCSK